MVSFYVRKIKNEDINKKTGKPWLVNDVPDVWRDKVEHELLDK